MLSWQLRITENHVPRNTVVPEREISTEIREKVYPEEPSVINAWVLKATRAAFVKSKWAHGGSSKGR